MFSSVANLLIILFLRTNVSGSDSDKAWVPNLEEMLQIIASVPLLVSGLPLRGYSLYLDEWFLTEADFISQETLGNVLRHFNCHTWKGSMDI